MKQILSHETSQSSNLPYEFPAGSSNMTCKTVCQGATHEDILGTALCLADRRSLWPTQLQSEIVTIIIGSFLAKQMSAGVALHQPAYWLWDLQNPRSSLSLSFFIGHGDDVRLHDLWNPSISQFSASAWPGLYKVLGD